MNEKIAGVAISAPNAARAVAEIQRAEGLGVRAAWMTSGGGGGESLTIFAAAAAQTERILLGTSIMQTWSRHPVTVAQQVQAIASLAPGRFRLGVGPGHKQGMERTFGADFRAPLGHLREYVRILKGLLQNGSIEFQGRYYSAHSTIPMPLDVPVMASALRPKSFELCGAEADGAISWVCPPDYLRDQALPAMLESAKRAGRPAPPLIVHVPLCVHEDTEAVHNAVRERLGYFPRSPFYARMFAQAGFPNSEQTGWTTEILDAVAISGDEETVARRIEEIFDWGASEVLASVVTVGDPEESSERTLKLLAQVSE